MIYHIDITEPAEVDMDEIGFYIARTLHAPESAEKLLDEIDRNILSLEQMPKRFALVSDERLASLGIRVIPVKNYLIFYFVDDNAITVTIARVLYNRRNWAQLL